MQKYDRSFSTAASKTQKIKMTKFNLPVRAGILAKTYFTID